jgi:uncharacterized damage-inducible protein DinB
MKFAMRWIPALLVVVLSVGLVACRGQAPQQTQPAAGQSTVLGDLRKDWQAQKDAMMQIADAMPEDKFSFKSTEAQRTFAEQIMHVATANRDMLQTIGGAAAAPAFTAEGATTKAQILQALADSYDYGAALLNEQTDATIMATVQGPSFLGASTRARIFWTLLGHSLDGYGQMAVYLRLNGIVPPASRGV